MSQARLALLGATGAVGRALLEAMAELALPMASLRVFASAASAGEGVALGRRELDVEDSAEFVPADFDLVFHAASDAVDPVAAAALAAGCRVIDLGGRIHGAEHVHAPLASMLAVLLRGLPADVDHLTVTAMLPVVAAGRHGVDELAQQTMALFNQKSYEREVFDRQVAFNLIPQVGKIGPDGCSDSERALQESLGLLLPQQAGLSVTVVQAPVFFGHSLSVEIELREAASETVLAKALADAGMEWTDMNPEGMVATPMDVLGQDRLLASRLRVHGRRISLWLTGDGLRMMAREAVRHAG
ncbi:hypothetical protein LH462_08225 [Laribacter hongkongensis]|uniref:Semialdehyde dehydrogenase NAD-binding domain-containing protein n=2 Tax=Laribacter hongkongensis TaxID=168471 RepID=A0ABD4SR83_9NEIS|nr:Asd/ArgC dimerization domain-containing protein [Laribacter hongkongensis]MCG9025722.1 hypothetical protein [Laribacter hongkongensis]MCG9101225.1 hypothetical protein [Laribacter hongkongensis]MCG9103706.1 hypothetical protein [Laribacter hongkongensis]MCG9112861.1 hypothetical protein [Laribacter hongkongensis]MCG9118847.1 hypothetical protein [Laribacter hongkongensis]